MTAMEKPPTLGKLLSAETISVSPFPEFSDSWNLPSQLSSSSAPCRPT
jgi:hypothetical protein